MRGENASGRLKGIGRSNLGCPTEKVRQEKTKNKTEGTGGGVYQHIDIDVKRRYGERDELCAKVYGDGGLENGGRYGANERKKT